MTPDERAERAAEVMWAGDQASRWFGASLDHVSAGSAHMSLTVAAHHCNGHAICHGGVIFALADSTFAFACNGRNRVTVAQHCMVSFLAPANAGDRLTAIAQEVSLTGRSGLYDVTVTRDDGVRIAEFRGMSRALSDTLFDEPGDA